jgi:hypothetical protein
VHVWEEPGADGASLGAVSIEVDRAGPWPGNDAHVWEEPGADGASLGAVSIEVDGAGPWPGNDAGVHSLTW